MQHGAYLLCLLVGLAGCAVIDYRYQLVIWRDLRAAVLTLAGGIVFFLGWDVAGIRLHIFSAGQSRYELGLRLLPQLPLEEVFFLALLVYLPLVITAWLERDNV